jgi:ArsR family transcriptional regulator, arsenate/arsenite/antimonite-responsive transcriptional repressor
VEISLYLPIFEALGHETRFKVFISIYRSGKAGVRPKEIIEKFGVDSGTLDFHLKRLVGVGLIVLKFGCQRGIYCPNENIPAELALLLDSSLAGNGLLMGSPASLTSPPVEHLH